MKNKNLLKDYYNAMKLLETRCDEETSQAIAPLLAKLIQQNSKLESIQSQLRNLIFEADMLNNERFQCDLMVRGWEKTKG
jgi:hypothetical protein